MHTKKGTKLYPCTFSYTLKLIFSCISSFKTIKVVAFYRWEMQVMDGMLTVSDDKRRAAKRVA